MDDEQEQIERVDGETMLPTPPMPPITVEVPTAAQRIEKAMGNQKSPSGRLSTKAIGEAYTESAKQRRSQILNLAIERARRGR